MGASVFGKAKNDCSWGLGGAGSPPGVSGRCLGEGVDVNPRTIFFRIKHAKMVIVRVNIE